MFKMTSSQHRKHDLQIFNLTHDFGKFTPRVFFGGGGKWFNKCFTCFVRTFSNARINGQAIESCQGKELISLIVFAFRISALELI